MQITAHPGPELVELRLTGRVDATWAEHLSTTIENAVRGGAHRVILNFAGVDYISSLGIRVLLVQYKLLKSVNGSLAISHPSEFCRNVLTTVGLADIMVDDDAALSPASAEAAPRQRRGAADYEVYPQRVTRKLSCSMIGDLALLATTGYNAADCRTLSFPRGTFALGLGAFGQNFEDCRGRFGEFLAAGGCAISLPTNEAHALPDYVVEEGSLVPQVETLYALSGEGDFPLMARFDAAPGGPGKVALSELAGSLLDAAAASTIAFVVLAEAAGIVGAALRRSPAEAPLVRTLPAVREWLSFTTERSIDKSLCLLVGVASRDVSPAAASFLRPTKPGSATLAHIHGAVFPYRPVQRGELPFDGTIAALLNASSPSAVLHLMADGRPFEGVGETDLSRGACWFGPIAGIARG